LGNLHTKKPVRNTPKSPAEVASPKKKRQASYGEEFSQTGEAVNGGAGTGVWGGVWEWFLPEGGAGRGGRNEKRGAKEIENKNLEGDFWISMSKENNVFEYTWREKKFSHVRQNAYPQGGR